MNERLLKTFRLLVLILLGASVFLTFIVLLPGKDIVMFNTEFINMKNLSIGNFEGVTKINWGIWLGCYYNADGHICTNKSWVSNPYTFTIVENGYQAQATVQQSWWKVLFMLFICFFNLVLILLMYFVLGHFFPAKTSTGFWRFIATKFVYYLAIINILGLFAIGGAEFYDYKSITNEMQSLGTGGNTSIITKVDHGLILSELAVALGATALIFVVMVYKVELWHIKDQRTKKYQQMHAQVGKLRIELGMQGMWWKDMQPDPPPPPGQARAQAQAQAQAQGGQGPPGGPPQVRQGNRRQGRRPTGKRRFRNLPVTTVSENGSGLSLQESLQAQEEEEEEATRAMSAQVIPPPVPPKNSSSRTKNPATSRKPKASTKGK